MIRNKEKIFKEIIVSKVIDANDSIDQDIIYLIGRKIDTGKNTVYEDLEIAILNGIDGKSTYIDLNKIKGYNPNISLCEFESSKKYEILFTLEEEIEKDGTRAIIYNVEKEKTEVIFDSSEYLLSKTYNIIYNDNYKVSLIDSNKNKEYIINIENKDYRYLSEKYDVNGKLKKSYSGQVLSAYEVSQVKCSYREVYDLLLKQKIIGEDVNDILGEIISTLRFDGEKFDEIDIKISIEDNKKIRGNSQKDEVKDKHYDFSNVYFIESECNSNLRIERAIEKEFSLSPNIDKMNYLYNRIKINNTSKYQLIAYLEGPKFCSPKGGTLVIIEEKNNNYVVTSKIRDIFPPIIVSENMSSGYNDLIVRLIKNDKYEFRVLKYNGNSYPMNPFDGYKLQSGIKIKGISVISDDLFYKRGIEY